MKRILVCLDGSERAPEVLRVAIDLGRRMGAKLRLFRAVGLPSEVPPRYFTAPANELKDILLDDGRKALSVSEREVPPELLDGVYAHVGTPWDGICRAAIDHDVDLIVLGSHGYGLLDRVLGTTASKVVNNADRNVLVVRPPRDPKAG